ncbi:MAG: hypothetical protein K8T91_08635, partial [Planctomycetes bacterium]|nr:hypothetical protein [Planctomycetota bacterium]
CPVSAGTFESYIRVDVPDDDPDEPARRQILLAATEFVENRTRQQLVTADFLLILDAFPANSREIRIPKTPLQVVDEVTYTDANGVVQTLDPYAYRVDTVSKPGRIILNADESWPATIAEPSAVTIAFSAGYGEGSLGAELDDIDSVPFMLRQAVLGLAAHWFEWRESATDRKVDTIPLALEAILTANTFPEAHQ